MKSDATSLSLKPIVCRRDASSGAGVDGVLVTGNGPQVVRAIADRAGMDSLDVLSSIVNNFLVKKGADWTAAILSDYLELYEDSAATFSLVWDDASCRLAVHGAIFQSASQPWAALVAHIRTADEFRGLGLGTAVTETLTATALRQGAGIVTLATDDKINRLNQGERAAWSMYAKLGFAILGESRLADTVDWLMAADRSLFELHQRNKAAVGRQPDKLLPSLAAAKENFVQRTLTRFAQVENGFVEPVTPGDLPGLFLLLSLCPKPDFQLKLTSWQIQTGPELERAFVTTVRQAVADRDRLHDASLVMRDESGAIVAICAAQLSSPFSRRNYAIDFYCHPILLRSSFDAVQSLVRLTMERISTSPIAPRPCSLTFQGVDSEKISLFKSLGFVETDNSAAYYQSNDNGAAASELTAKEYRHWIV